MSPVDKAAPGATAVAEPPPAAAGFASRDDILGAAGRFAEAEFELEGVGKVLLSEISGQARAEILGQMATAIEGNKLSDPTWTAKYQKAMLRNGVVDPTSPAGDRKPFFREGDLDRLMKLGGAKIAALVDEIEKLSRMGSYQESAEGNSVITLNGASSSG
jgi:hypothetical protein